MKQSSLKPINIQSIAECEQLAQTFYKSQKIQFNCSCGKPVQLTVAQLLRKPKLLCSPCKVKDTLLTRYGVTNASKLESVKRKKEQTCQKHFGVKNPSNSNVVKQKRRETNKKLYGSENWFSSSTFMTNPEIKQKVKQTNRVRYDTDFYAQSKTFKDRNSEIQQKRRNTFRRLYGVDSNLQLPDVRLKSRTGRYTFEDQTFDSSWELALWIYAKDHNEEIEREPCSFEYELNKKAHKYIPDFKYKGQLIEIKGDQFFDKNGILKNPYGPIESIQAKIACAKMNSVLIWRKESIQFALDYVKNTYGKDYLKSQRTKLNK